MNPARTEQHSTLNRIYLNAADDLLLGSAAVSSAGPKSSASAQNYISLLGATGAHLAISSMIRISKQALAALHPLAAHGLSDEALEDWCRELNNQLVGRMKNKLLGFGVTLTLGLPVLLNGTDLIIAATPDTTKTENRIETPSGEVTLILQARIDPALVLEETNLFEEAAVLEGVVSLF